MSEQSATFDLEDQTRFAELSGDYNPMHIDVLAARRLTYGGLVVHGIHTVLKSLEVFADKIGERFRLLDLSVVFRQPVLVSSVANFRINDNSKSDSEIEVIVGHTVVATIKFAWCDVRSLSFSLPDHSPPIEKVCLLAPSEISGVSGSIELSLEQKVYKDMFPSLSRSIDSDQAAVLVSTSRVVGMKVPGNDSLFSELTIKFGATKASDELLCYKVVQYDERFAHCVIKFSCGESDGLIRAFLRPRQKNQRVCPEVLSSIDPGEFASVRALIVGGSRGLGETCAKLLSSGSAGVAITYKSGRDDAIRVLEDIEASGGSAKAYQFDALEGSDALVAAISDWRPTHFFYFATPAIFRPRYQSFSAAYMREFESVYVSAFAEIFYAIESTGNLRYVFYPSSAAIDEVTKGIPEYAAAKCAGEYICSYLRKYHPKIDIESPRLPRMATDQTASVFAKEAKEAYELMLHYLKKSVHSP